MLYCLYNLFSYFTILIFPTCDSYKCDAATVRRKEEHYRILREITSWLHSALCCICFIKKSIYFQSGFPVLSTGKGILILAATSLLNLLP